jgi:hypothetical protein
VRGEGVLDDRDDGAAKVGVADVRAVMNESIEDRVEERDDFRGGLLSSAGPSCFKPGFDVVCLAPVAMNDQVFLMRVITGRSQPIPCAASKCRCESGRKRERRGRYCRSCLESALRE